MIETLQKDSPAMPLEQHKRDIIQAIDDAEDAAIEAPEKKAGENNFVSELGPAAVGGAVLSVFMTVREEMALGQNHNNPPAQNKGIFVNHQNTRTNSLFVGGGAITKAMHQAVPLVPQSYGEKKEALKKSPDKAPKGHDILARSRLASMSLTGASMSHSKKAPIKGASVTPSAAQAVNVSWLQDELAATQRAIDSPYENMRRLQEDLRKGVDSAEQYVQRKLATPSQSSFARN